MGNLTDSNVNNNVNTIERFTDSSIIFICIRYIIRLYRNSFTAKVFELVLSWCKNSSINRFITKFLARDTSLPHSKFHKFCSVVYGFFDRMFERIYSFGQRCFSTSCVIQFFRVAFFSGNNLLSIALLFLFGSFGYGLTLLVIGRLYTMNILLCMTGIIVSLILLPGNVRWKEWLSGSFVWRFVLYIFD